MAQMKEQVKTPEKIQLRDEDIGNLSGAQFKILVIRMLTEMIEYGCKIKEKVKVIQSEIKKIYRVPTVKGRKPGLTSTIWNRRKTSTFDWNR